MTTTPRYGHPLVDRNERAARRWAGRAIENSTLGRGDLARLYRLDAHQAVSDRQCQWAGFWRRMAELLEGGLS